MDVFNIQGYSAMAASGIYPSSYLSGQQGGSERGGEKIAVEKRYDWELSEGEIGERREREEIEYSSIMPCTKPVFRSAKTAM